ncbi:MAG TPA: 5-oxoprolinase subunit PxpB [Beijerinckiaceae bacterium]|jgi:KipI family sensor histidine kinase inhibitor
MQASGAPRLLPAGDAALVVEFGEAIDPGLNARVLALDARAAGLSGIVETVPTYRSLLVHYDPTATDFRTLGDALLALSGDLPDTPAEGRLWRIPVVYGGEFGIDLTSVAAHHGIAADELIRRHSAPVYRVYMMGFLPGFAYLGGLDPSIAISRRESPRLRTPAGTISIGGIQALVASIEAPSGWHLLGRTPVRNFMAARDPVFILDAGDRVKFEAVPAAEWPRLDAAAQAGEIVAEAVG